MFLITWSYFVEIFHSALSTKEMFQNMSQTELCMSIFIPHNKNRCISSIINESPTTFRFMQIFEVTVINKCMFCPTLVFIRFEITVINKCMFFPTLLFILFDITCAYEHSIKDYSHNTGCTPGFSFYARYWSHLHNISHT